MIDVLCLRGLEALVGRELEGLGLGGKLSFEGSLADVYRANLHLRCAERVLFELGRLRATGFPELRRKAARLPWEAFLVPGRPIAIRVSCRRSRLYHEAAVAERLAAAAEDRLKSPCPRAKGEAAGAAQLVFARIEDDVCRVSLDSSGEPLHRRGYRLATAKAPLKESLACALVLASGWDGSTPLLDPFCGSGTIAVEAALLARNLAPGRQRRFAFMDWPGFDAALWEQLLAKAAASAREPAVRILGSDRDEGAICCARENAARAGVADSIEFSCRALSAVEPPAGPGTLISNPPYGVRLKGTGDLRDLYARLGAVLCERCPGWRAALLCADRRLLRETGLGFEVRLTALNGGLKVFLACSR